MSTNNNFIPKFLSVDGSWVSATDVSEPDILMDPGDYFEWLYSLDIQDKIKLGLANQDEIDEYNDISNADDYEYEQDNNDSQEFDDPEFDDIDIN
jgi:hypothetical protein